MESRIITLFSNNEIEIVWCSQTGKARVKPDGEWMYPEGSSLLDKLKEIGNSDGASAYMYPVDLQDFCRKETNARAFSVGMCNASKGETVPLFTLDMIDHVMKHT